MSIIITTLLLILLKLHNLEPFKYQQSKTPQAYLRCLNIRIMVVGPYQDLLPEEEVAEESVVEEDVEAHVEEAKAEETAE